jgi:hypothetical protein
MNILDKVMNNSGPAFVYADESGKLSRPNQDTVILAAIMVYGARMNVVNEYYETLKQKVRKWGVDVDDPKFEFHSSEMFSKTCHTINNKEISSEQLNMVAKYLKNAIKESGISYAIVKIDKRKPGFGYYCEDYEKTLKNEISRLPEEILYPADRLLRQLGVRKGIGLLGDITGLFFGLITGKISRDEVKNTASVIVDKEFLEGIEMWQVLFNLNYYCFKILWDYLQPELEKNPQSPVWPKNAPPEWHLGEKVGVDKSQKHFGLQLADFLAFTTRHLDDFGDPVVNKWALFSQKDLVSLEFRGSPGVWVFTSSKFQSRDITNRARLWQKNNKLTH